MRTLRGFNLTKSDRQRVLAVRSFHVFLQFKPAQIDIERAVLRILRHHYQQPVLP